MVLMVDGHLRMYISELNDGDYFPPVTELEDDKINNFLVMMVLLNTSQMIDMCSVLRMVFHPKIRTNWEVKYWLCGSGISLYQSMTITGQDRFCIWMPKNMHMQR